jgi:hypothetical protein
MKNTNYSGARKIIVVIASGVVVLLCASVAYIVTLIVIAPSEKMTIEGIQTRTPFTICGPTYLPAGVDPKPEIQSDFSDPVEIVIRLLYRDPTEKITLVEIVQTHIPNTTIPDFLGTNRESFARALIAWVVGWPNVDTYRDETEVTALSYQEENSEHGLFEIRSPISLRANMVAWKKYPVFYQVFTRLSAQEARNIADSVADCGRLPTKTP